MVDIRDELERLKKESDSIWNTEEDLVRLVKATPSAIEMGIHEFRMARSTYQAALRNIIARLQWGEGASP